MDLNPQPRRFADRSRPALEITITGLRPGEKLHEVLLGAGEADSRPVHPLISHVAVPTLDPWGATTSPARLRRRVAAVAQPGMPNRPVAT